MQGPLNMLFMLALGAGGWWLTHWVINPILDIHRVRKRVHEELVYYAHIGAGAAAEDAPKMAAAFRRLAAELLREREAATWLVRAYLSVRRLDLEQSARGLIGLSHMLADAGGKQAAAPDAIAHGLLLPLSNQDRA